MTRQLWFSWTCLISTLIAAVPAMSQCNGGAWAEVAEMRLLRQGMGVGRVGNLLYIYGGLQSDDPISPILVADVLDLETGSSEPIQFSPSARYYPASAVLRGEPYLIGGFQGNYDPSNLVWAYDPTFNSWDRKADLPRRRAGSAAASHDDRIYVFGGVAANLVAQASAYAYDPGQNAWLTLTNMPTRRERMAIAEADGLIYVVGGFDQNGQPLAVVERYDPSLDEWTVLAPMNVPRGGAAGGIVNGKLYVMGGENGEMVAPTEVFDLGSGQWSCRTEMTTPRHSMVSVPGTERILLVGGSVTVGVTPVSLVDAFTPPDFVANRETSMGSFKSRFGSRRSP